MSVYWLVKSVAVKVKVVSSVPVLLKAVRVGASFTAEIFKVAVLEAE